MRQERALADLLNANYKLPDINMFNFLKSQAYNPDPSILSLLDEARILVTGASGLIGLNIITSLLAAREQGTKLSITAVLGSERLELRRFFQENKVDAVQYDLGVIDMKLELGKFDVIIHAASYGQPGKFMINKLSTITLNTTTLQKLSNHLAPGGRLLFMSTSELYSGHVGLSQSEIDIGVTTPQHPRACYIEAKRLGETICEILRENGVLAFSARLALGYGPGVWHDDQRVINQFIQKAIIHSRIDLLDSGEGVRTYVYINNVVEMLLNIVMKGRSSVYNVGGTSQIKIRKLADMIGLQLNVPVHSPVTSKGVIGAPQTVSLDLNRYETEFGNVNYIPLTEGIANTVMWYKKILGK